MEQQSVSSYVTVYIWLLVLTGISVIVSLIGFGEGALFVAMVLACMKARLVGQHFMHLDHAGSYNRLAFVVAFVFVILMAAVTLLEFETRDEVNPETDTFELRKERSLDPRR